MNRADHLQWCKDRAKEYLDAGNVQDGITSMMSDLAKHPETQGSSISLGALAIMKIVSGDIDEARRFVEGFN